MKIKKSKMFIISMLILCFALSIMPMKVLANSEIGDVDIEGVTFNYNPGDAPKATAYKCDPWDEQYDIEYECWEEMEKNAKGESVPVKYWYSDESKNNALSQDKKIITFEEGKTYMYSIFLKAKDGNTFATDKKVMVNGTYVNSTNVTNSGTKLFVVAVKTIKPKTVTYQHISKVEINNATLSFKVGDTPVFTGKTPENAPYIYQFECWETKDGAGITSAEFFNKGYENQITAFESGKEYKYILYFKSAEGYTFTRDTKLKINGKYYNYTVSDWEYETNVSEFSTTWRMYPDLTMTPTSSEPTQDTVKEIESTGAINASIAFEKEVSKNYKLDIKQIEISKDLSDKNVKYLVDINILDNNNQIVKISDTKMKIRIALSENLKGFNKYEVVYILNNEIKETIPATIEDGYIVFETTHLSEYGIVATTIKEPEQDKNETNNPKTGDNVIENVILFVASISTIGILIVINRKKVRE